MRILFITSTRIGDAVLSTGILEHLVQTYPDARFTVACGPLAESLFAAVPRLERVIVVTKARFDLHWFRLWREVRGTTWDMVVDLRRSLLSFLLRTHARHIVGKPAPRAHRIQDLSAIFSLSTPAAPHLHMSAAHIAAATRLIPDGPPTLALAPLAAQPHKVWPMTHFASLVERLDAGACAGWRFAVFGAGGERAAAQPLLDRLPRDRYTAIFGETELLVVAAALARCRAFVGNDTGLSHMAAAVRTPTLALFGATDILAYAPWGAAAIQAPGPSHDLANLSPAEVATAFERLPLPPS